MLSPQLLRNDSENAVYIQPNCTCVALTRAQSSPPPIRHRQKPINANSLEEVRAPSRIAWRALKYASILKPWSSRRREKA